MRRFEGRVAIVTGGTSGIGRETALRLAAEGATVVATGRDPALGAETEARAGALPVRFARQDVSEEEGWRHLIAQVERDHGRLDCLVGNAGHFAIRAIAETTLAAFDEAYRVNAEGCWLGMKHAMPAMARAGGGAIVNVSSLMGLVGLPDATAYCASKGAVTALSRAGAVEGAPLGIRVNSLHPGVIWTRMLEATFGDDAAVRDALTAGTPLRLEGRPEHVAEGILYLLSDAARHVTGTALTIDGGRGAD